MDIKRFDRMQDRRLVFALIAAIIFLGLSWVRHKNLNAPDILIASIGAIWLLSLLNIDNKAAFNTLRIAKMLVSSFLAGIFLAAIFILIRWPWSRVSALDFSTFSGAFEFALFLAGISFVSWLWLSCAVAYFVVLFLTKRMGSKAK